MKEYITREIKPGQYEYGYKIQLFDIKLLKELGILLPDKMNEVYKDKIDKSKLSDFLYFNDPEIYEFIKNQYYIRDTFEFNNMSLYEIEILLNFINEQIEGLMITINKVSNKERLNHLNMKLKILNNEMQGIMFLRDSKIFKENKKK